MNEKQRLEKVLGWVNKIRKEQFRKRPLKKIPPGRVGNGAFCPIHNCFKKSGDDDVLVGAYLLTVNRNSGHTKTFKYPKRVSRFLVDFDNGKYPNLIKRG